MKKSIRAVLLVFLSMVLMFGSVTSVWGVDLNWDMYASEYFDFNIYSHGIGTFRSTFWDVWRDVKESYIVIPEQTDRNDYDFTISFVSGSTVSTSDVRFIEGTDKTSPRLVLDYSVSVDLKPDEDGIPTAGGAIMLIYLRPEELNTIISQYSSAAPFIPFGYQIIRDVRAGTEGGEEYISHADDLEVRLPDNFSFDKCSIGVCFLQVEGTFSTMVVTSTNIAPLNAGNGDANGDGVVNILDVSLMLKYTAEWDMDINIHFADVNGNRRVGLDDASTVMKLIAGWDLTK